MVVQLVVGEHLKWCVMDQGMYRIGNYESVRGFSLPK